MISIVIVNWKSKDFVRKCIASIRATAQDLSPQIIVVDGGSFDGCGEILQAEFPEVEFVQSLKNVGFGRANNLGVERVNRPLLLLLNPDTELSPRSLHRLIEELESHPDAGMVGPRLTLSDGTLQQSCVQALPTPLNQVLDSDLLRRLFPKSSLWGTGSAFEAKSALPVEAVVGACMLMRAEVFRRVGGFSPEFFMYGEDLDLCAKVQKLKLQIYYVPDVEVFHYAGGSSTGSFSKVSNIFMHHSVFIFMGKNHGRVSAYLYRMLMFLSSVVRIPLLGVMWLVAHSVTKARLQNSIQKWYRILTWSVGLEHRTLNIQT